jgi:hypothetical protein
LQTTSIQAALPPLSCNQPIGLQARLASGNAACGGAQPGADWRRRQIACPPNWPLASKLLPGDTRRSSNRRSDEALPPSIERRSQLIVCCPTKVAISCSSCSAYRLATRPEKCKPSSRKKRRSISVELYCPEWTAGYTDH